MMPTAYPRVLPLRFEVRVVAVTVRSPVLGMLGI